MLSCLNRLAFLQEASDRVDMDLKDSALTEALERGKSTVLGSDPAANIDLPARLARRSSQFLITPTENIDRGEMMSEFSRALMATSTGSDTM